MKISNIWKHFCTVSKHRYLVMQGCFKMGLYYQGLTHDLSKFSPVEFLAGCKYYQGNRSPNDAQRRAVGYSASWLHHKGRNKHHLEYWIDYAIDNEQGGSGFVLAGMKMPEKYVAEMFADRIAASKVYHKESYTDATALEYYEKGKAHTLMHKETEALLHKMLTVLAEKGEDEAFRFVKYEVLKKGKRNA
ncbi:MAG: DUF5662 family protein [Eubacterium sp.]|nr:DUF5662 family protein [Eubacterium sp.]